MSCTYNFHIRNTSIIYRIYTTYDEASWHAPLCPRFDPLLSAGSWQQCSTTVRSMARRLARGVFKAGQMREVNGGFSRHPSYHWMKWLRKIAEWIDFSTFFHIFSHKDGWTWGYTVWKLSFRPMARSGKAMLALRQVSLWWSVRPSLALCAQRVTGRDMMWRVWKGYSEVWKLYNDCFGNSMEHPSEWNK